MPVLYANRAFSTLASSITNVATSLTVAAGHGARFPTISGSDYFFATLDNNAGTVEIVKVTARSTDTFTIVRAQDGTSASAFNAGAGVELRLVKAMLDDLKTDARLTASSNINVPSAGRVGYLAQTDVSTVAGVSIANYGATFGATFTGMTNPGTAIAGYDGIVFSTVGVERMRLTTNLCLGAAASAAVANTTFEIGANKSGAFGALGDGPVDHAYVSGNAYPTGSADPAFTTWKYTRTGASALYEAGRGGTHLWYTAASGTAGNTTTFLERMRITSSGDLLIGTTTAGYKVEVNGTVRVNVSGGTAAELRIRQTGWAEWVIQNPVSSNAFTIVDNSSGSPFERVRIDSSGNVGVGYTSGFPAASAGGSVSAGLFAARSQLNVHQTSMGVLQFGSANNLTQIRSYGATAGTGQIAFNVGGGGGSADTEAMRLDASGNLGLGVTPSAWGSNFKAFESAGNSFVAIAAANINGINIISNGYADNTNWIYKTTGAVARYSVNTGVHQWFTAPSGTAGNTISFTQAMTLDASGRLLVGTTSAITGVNSQVEQMQLYGAGGAASSYAVHSASDTLSANIRQYRARAGTTALQAGDAIGVNAFVGYTGTAWANVARILGAVDTASGGNLGGRMVFDTATTAGALTERMRIDSAGNVGIGLTNAGAPLHVYGATNATQIRAGDGNVLTYVAYSSGTSTTAVNYYGTFSNHAQAFITNNQERARLDVSGNFLVGTTDVAGNTTNTAVSLAGIFRSHRTTVTAANNTATTIITLSSSPVFATYIVSAGIDNTADPVNYHCVAIVCTQNGAAKITNTVTASLFSITMSGMSIRVTQQSGLSTTCAATITRVA